jgi:hypothetical protein
MHLAHLADEQERNERARREADEAALEKKRAAWLAQGPPRSCTTPAQVEAWRIHTMSRIA